MKDEIYMKLIAQIEEESTRSNDGKIVMPKEPIEELTKLGFMYEIEYDSRIKKTFLNFTHEDLSEVIQIEV